MSIGTKQKTPRTNCFYAKNRHHLLSSSNNFYSLTKEKQSEIESMLFGLRAAYTLTHFLAVCVYALGYCLVFQHLQACFLYVFGTARARHQGDS